MTRPVVGIIGNHHLINEEYEIHGGGRLNSQAIARVSQALPLIVPTDPEIIDVDALCEVCDGFLFTGGRANVHPSEYGEDETEAHGAFDRERDRLALTLIRRSVEEGRPILAICRGFQELGVAFGSRLHPEIREIEGRQNHRMPPDGTLEEKFELRHDVTFTEGGTFHRLMGAQTVRTNTLHGQGITQAGDRIVIDGWAEDGTPEAIYVSGAAGFALGVQWHPEWRADEDPVSVSLFSAFGEALSRWRQARTGRADIKKAG